jgi:hypothetical protein
VNSIHDILADTLSVKRKLLPITARETLNKADNLFPSKFTNIEWLDLLQNFPVMI